MDNIYKNIFHEGNEVFQNGLYKREEILPSFQNFFAMYGKDLEDILSIQIEKSIRDYADKPTEFMNIETKRFLTNIRTRRGMDLCISQFDKEKSLNFGYQPYSYPGYNVFILMMLAYYTKYNTLPLINFDHIDISNWNENTQEYSAMKEMIRDVRTTKEVSLFFYGQKFLNYDKNGIYRIIPQKEGNEKWLGFGIEDEISTFNFLSSPADNDSSAMLQMETNLIPLYMQAIFDIHRSVANSENAVGFKKIYDMTKYLVEQEMYGKDFDYRKAWNETPILKTDF